MRLPVIGGVVKAVKGLLGGGSLVTGIEFDNEAERRIAKGVYLFCLACGAYMLLKGLALIVGAITGNGR
ncbi:MAG: hypothetical protein ABT940_03460 [Alphaproteobacteria bacterium]